MLGVAQERAAAQAFFSSPADKRLPRPLPWQERGLRAALADPSPLLSSMVAPYLSKYTLLPLKALKPSLAEELQKTATDAVKQPHAEHAADGAGPGGHQASPFAPESTEAERKKEPEKIAPERVKALLTQLHDPDSSVRREAVEALGRAGPLATAEMGSALVPLLEDADFDVASSTVDALRDMGREEEACRKALLRLLQTPGSAGYGTVYQFITMSPEGLYTEGIPIIIPLLAAPSQGLREAVVDCLQRMGPAVAPYVKDVVPLFHNEWPGVRTDATRALTHVGDEAAPTVARALLPLLKGEDENLRFAAIHALGRLGSAAAPVALPALLPFLKKKNSENRFHAVIALGRMGAGAAPAAKELLAVIDDPDEWQVVLNDHLSQHAAAEALGHLGPSVAPLLGTKLVPHFKDGDGFLNHHMLRGFTCMDPAAALYLNPAILKLLQGADKYVRDWTKKALEFWGNFKSDPAWQCAALALTTAAENDEDLQALRFSLYLWSGHDPELLLSVRWLGRPAASPVPATANGTGLGAAEQQAALRMLLKLWDASAPYPALRREMAGRMGELAQSITAAPEENVAALLKSVDERLKADEVKETQETSATARNAVQSVLGRAEGKR